MEKEVLLYIFDFIAFFGFVIILDPLGAFNPSLFLTILFGDVLALKLFFKLGLRIPNFISIPQK